MVKTKNKSFIWAGTLTPTSWHIPSTRGGFHGKLLFLEYEAERSVHCPGRRCILAWVDESKYKYIHKYHNCLNFLTKCAYFQVTNGPCIIKYTNAVLTSGWAEDSRIRTLERAYQRSRHLLHQCPRMQKVLLSCMGKTPTSLHCPQIWRQKQGCVNLPTVK